jgi:hypothetical protein
MTYTEIYTAINTALTAIAVQKYYTLVPTNVVYPHILVQIISDVPGYTKDVASVSGMLTTYRVQIDVRAKDQTTVSAHTYSVMAAMHNATEFFARKETSGSPLVWDTNEHVYRSVNDYIIKKI